MRKHLNPRTPAATRSENEYGIFVLKSMLRLNPEGLDAQAVRADLVLYLGMCVGEG